MFGKIVPMWAAFIIYGLLLGRVCYEVGVFFPQGVLMAVLLIFLGVQLCKHRDNERYKIFGIDGRIAYGIDVMLVGLCCFWAYFSCRLDGFVALGTFSVVGACFYLIIEVTLIRYGK